MGVRYDEGGEDQGRAVLLDLARDPSTAQHIAKKFVRHFVADNPPAELVEGLASTFEGTGGDLRAMTLGLVNSETAWQPTGKFKTPQEFVWSALRALSIDIDAPFVKKVLVDLGQPIFNAPSPQGFSDDSSEWLAPDAITSRLDVATQLAARAPVDADPNDIARAVLGPLASQDTMTTIAKAGSRTQALALLMMSPEFQRR
jgi:uncharacterized protein (DUF1800 family)